MVDPGPVARRVARKELRILFSSPVAWLFLGSFAACCLFVVFWVEAFFARNIADVRPLFEWMPLLLAFLCPALTMRAWSEERRTGTLEHVLVQPTALWRFVLGKFYAALALLALALAATGALPVTVALIADLDWGPVWAGYLASLLLGACYLAVGLYVSARTDNPIVSLIGSVLLCSALYLVGDGLLTDLFDSATAQLLQQFGTGARFESIARGVIDFRDLLYYATLTIAFLALNAFELEREGWARFASTPRQRHWRIGIPLLLANLLLLNLWAERVVHWRLDVTQGRLYSISEASASLLGQLQEPLLIRGYFSARNHPLLAPLEPQLKNLLREYEAAGGGRVRIELVDPAEDPALEQEANERFGIRPSPLQVADRHQSAVVNAYFDLLVQYGSEFQTLTFGELIEVRTTGDGEPEVQLRNPEFDITRAIRDALYQFRSGGDLFQGIERPVEMIGYISDDALLPPTLVAYRESMVAQLDAAVAASRGKLSYRLLDPQAGDGALAGQIQSQWGFAPMTTGLDSEQSFYFYLTLADREQVVQLPTGDFDPGRFRAALDTGLKRFARHFTRTVALAAPPGNPELARYGLSGPTFANLERLVVRDYSLVSEDLGDGSVDPEADILAVVAPRQLEPAALFAIDQFLMRGGTVLLASSSWHVAREDGQLELTPWDSGLAPWLEHHGITIGRELVADRQHGTLPTPVTRNAGEHSFQDTRLVGYPFFIDVRASGIARHTLTSTLPQVTMAWMSPVSIERRNAARVSRLLWSSPRSWLSDGSDIAPVANARGQVTVSEPAAEQQLGAQTLGAVVQGSFRSFFDAVPALPLRPGDMPAPSNLLTRSPESARIVVFGSNDFLSDRVLAAQVQASGTQYLGPLELFGRTLDWALQEALLLDIRSRAHFNRTLPPMERRAQVLLESFNYGAALLWLGLVALLWWLRTRLRRRRMARELGL